MLDDGPVRTWIRKDIGEYYKCLISLSVFIWKRRPGRQSTKDSRKYIDSVQLND